MPWSIPPERRSSSKRKSHHGPLRCARELRREHPPLRAGVALTTTYCRSIVTRASRESSFARENFSRSHVDRARDALESDDSHAIVTIRAHARDSADRVRDGSTQSSRLRSRLEQLSVRSAVIAMRRSIGELRESAAASRAARRCRIVATPRRPRDAAGASRQRRHRRPQPVTPADGRHRLTRRCCRPKRKRRG